jgi:F-box and WD-40 domain protein 1/11
MSSANHSHRPSFYYDNSDDFDIIDGSSFSVLHAMTVTRPPSPSLSFDFSFITPPSPSPDRNSFPSASRPGGPQSYLFPPYWSRSSSARDKRYNTIHGTPSSYRAILPQSHRTLQSGKSMKCIIPRLLDALSPPSRKVRRKTTRWKSYSLPSNVSYADLQPLDGEEGELIDEACYVDTYDALPSPPPKCAGPSLISHSVNLLSEILVC